MDYSKGQDAPGTSACHPIKELSCGPTSLSLKSDQHLNQHQAFNASTIQTQKSVHPAEERRELIIFYLKVSPNVKTFLNKNTENIFNSLCSLHCGAIHFQHASAHCTDCSPHMHDVLKPCQPITTNSCE